MFIILFVHFYNVVHYLHSPEFRSWHLPPGFEGQLVQGQEVGGGTLGDPAAIGTNQTLNHEILNLKATKSIS